jgi:hypothetical protein
LQDAARWSWYFRINYNCNSGSTLFQGDVPAGDVINFSFPEDGILFPKGVYVKLQQVLQL